MLPPLVVGPRQDLRGGGLDIGDGGDQGDQLVLAVPSRSGTSYSITRTYQAWSSSRSSPRRAASIRAVPLPAGDLRVDQDRPVGAVGQHLQHRQPRVTPGPATAAPPRYPRPCASPSSSKSPGRRSAASPAPGPGTDCRARACSPLPFPPEAGPIAASTGACDPHSLTVTTRIFGNAARSPPPRPRRRPGSPPYPGHPTPSRPPTSAATAPGTPRSCPGPRPAPRPG